MAVDIDRRPRREDPVGVLRNVFRHSPAEPSWEPMQLNSCPNRAIAGEASNTARSMNSEDDVSLDSSRECRFRPRGGYICVDSLEDVEDPGQLAEDDGEDLDLPLEELPETIYSFAIASLIQDSIQLHEHPKYCFTTLRPGRILAAFLLCALTFCLQAILLVETKRLVTPEEVSNIRQVYGDYEHTMYEDSNGTSHTHKTSNGYDRGNPGGYFNRENFEKLRKIDKDMVCRIPLSQPLLLSVILFVWTLTVLSHVRDILNTSARIWMVRDLGHDRVHDVVETKNVGQSEEINEVQGLTWWMKASILLCVQIPRLLMTAMLLWIGGRWLIATVGFGDLLLNCVALEFILNLAQLLYNVLVPYSGKMLVKSIYLPHLHRHEHENCANMFGMFSCGLVACVMVWIYMYYLQAVLPEYHWDVRPLCEKYLAAELLIHNATVTVATRHGR